jgi:CRP/FNR family nitrogen fixation transcriptional regulator
MYAAALIKTDNPFHAPSAPGRARHEMSALSFFGAEAEVYAQGEESGSLYQIEYGAVRIYRLLADGRRQVVAFQLPGETFGFEADCCRSFFAEAMVNTALRIQECTLQNASPAVVAEALRSMIRAQEHLLVVGRQNAMERMAAFLVEMADRQEDTDQVELPMTRLDIADYLGMTIETASRSLSALKQQGFIRVPTLRSVEFVRFEGLRRLCR